MRPNLKRPKAPYQRPPRNMVRIWTAQETRNLQEHERATTQWICDALEYLLARDAETNGCPGCGMVGKSFCICKDAPSVYDLSASRSPPTQAHPKPRPKVASARGSTTTTGSGSRIQ